MKDPRHNIESAALPIMAALGLFAVCAGCLSSPPKAGMGGGSTLQVADGQRDALWERAVVVLNRNHFQVASESKLEGIIDWPIFNLADSWLVIGAGLMLILSLRPQPAVDGEPAP